MSFAGTSCETKNPPNSPTVSNNHPAPPAAPFSSGSASVSPRDQRAGLSTLHTFNLVFMLRQLPKNRNYLHLLEYKNEMFESG